jgi:hypothetical protein
VTPRKSIEQKRHQQQDREQQQGEEEEEGQRRRLSWAALSSSTQPTTATHPLRDGQQRAWELGHHSDEVGALEVHELSKEDEEQKGHGRRDPLEVEQRAKRGRKRTPRNR